MHEEWVNEITRLMFEFNDDNTMGEDDFGYSLGILPATEIPKNIWDAAKPREHDDYAVAVWSSNGSRTVITTTEAAAREALAAAASDYEEWLEA